jgi:hypothetical protein
MIEEQWERAEEARFSPGGAQEGVQRPWWCGMFGRLISAHWPSANFAITEFSEVQGWFCLVPYIGG